SEVADLASNTWDSVVYLSTPSPSVILQDGINNKASAYLSDEEKTTVLYSDPFYRNRLLILHGITTPYIALAGPLSFADDRASSLLTY
ncbi:MAG: hypothetical protein WBH03_11715, partial [Cyclobacteriaceae bacterium]